METFTADEAEYLKGQSVGRLVDGPAPTPRQALACSLEGCGCNASGSDEPSIRLAKEVL